jgi:hypothetical protein
MAAWVSLAISSRKGFWDCMFASLTHEMGNPNLLRERARTAADKAL